MASEDQSHTKRNRRILVIDDNPAIQDDFRKILCRETATASIDADEAALFGPPTEIPGMVNFKVDTASQGREGLQKVVAACAEGSPYALAFVDVRMPPGWDGIETISQIWKVCPEIQFVICTAYSDYSWEEIYRKVGQNDNVLILKKPFDNIEVLQLAHALTQKWEVTRRARRRQNQLSPHSTELLNANEQTRDQIVTMDRGRYGLVDDLRESPVTDLITRLGTSIPEIQAIAEQLLLSAAGAAQRDQLEQIVQHCREVRSRVERVRVEPPQARLAA